MNELVKYDVPELMELGRVFAASGFFSDTRGEAQAIVKILAGSELGFGPLASMTGVHVIKGRVTLSANLIAAAIKRSGKYDYRVIEHSDTACEIAFFDQGEEIGRSRFTMQDAKKAGLSGANWSNYPRNMLFARALSNGAKWHTPDIFGGPLYTPDELGAEVDGETGEVVTVERPEEEAAEYASSECLCAGCNVPIAIDSPKVEAAIEKVRQDYGRVLCRSCRERQDAAKPESVVGHAPELDEVA